MATEPPLSQAVGYGLVIGLGLLFALGMILTTYVLKRYQNEIQTSEMFSTAGRTVKSGLVASAVVSSWSDQRASSSCCEINDCFRTWAATLLQSSGVAYRYGVSGPFWCVNFFPVLMAVTNGTPGTLQVQPFRSCSSPLWPLN